MFRGYARKTCADRSPIDRRTLATTARFGMATSWASGRPDWAILRALGDFFTLNNCPILNLLCPQIFGKFEIYWLFYQGPML
jgi:hypothetical protein